MTTSSNCCNIERREPDFFDSAFQWRHTGACGYYAIFQQYDGSIVQGTCTVSGRVTNYYDKNFMRYIHPDYYEQVWKDYEDLLQPCLKIN